ncbi:hypothetical protein C3Y90_13515 [Rhizobium sp. UPM1134]|nr:hypothetical protein [Rhizobium ruizarguesonis]
MPFRSIDSGLEQFQQKCAAVLRSELRENKEIEHFRDSEKNGNALEIKGLRPCRSPPNPLGNRHCHSQWNSRK